MKWKKNIMQEPSKTIHRPNNTANIYTDWKKEKKSGHQFIITNYYFTKPKTYMNSSTQGPEKGRKGKTVILTFKYVRSASPVPAGH